MSQKCAMGRPTKYLSGFEGNPPKLYLYHDDIETDQPCLGPDCKPTDGEIVEWLETGLKADRIQIVGTDPPAGIYVILYAKP